MTNATVLDGIVQTPVTFVDDDAGVEQFLADFARATTRALDTETYGWEDGGTPQLRVVSAAALVDGSERSWVIDARDIDVVAMCEGLTGLEVSGWNATYDEKVLDDAAGVRLGLVWFDAMLADAVLHQGETGFDFYRGLAKVAKEKTGLELTGKGTTQTSFDADSDLSDEQIRYAALDAVATLRVTEAIRAELSAQNLEQANALEQRARPFLSQMQRSGMPIDWQSWQGELAQMQHELEESLAALARLTGGGQADIFSMLEKPSWKPDSSADVKRILNDYDPERVMDHFSRAGDARRLFEKVDKADKDTLKSIGGPICETLLAYRADKKILSTYGDNLQQWIGPDGRMHPEYVQVIGTDTGRLSSRKPNAQNFTPRLKKHFRPASDDRVFAYADLSQAELRFLAQVSGDEGMRDAFRQGRDIHVATAERMFGVDMDALADDDPKKHKEYRSKAKTLNFGIVYGLGPVALANSLTLSGVETTTDEAKALLAAYLEAYPGVKAWLARRDGYVRGLAAKPPQVDFAATMALYDTYSQVRSTIQRFRKAEGHEPDDDELVDALWPQSRIRRELSEKFGRDATDDEVAKVRLEHRGRLKWARGFFAPVVLGVDGAPVGFVSYTEVGRQRRFQVLTDSLLLAMCTIVCQSRKSGPQQLRESFAKRNGIELSRNGKYLGRDELAKAFEDRALRRGFVAFVMSSVDANAQSFLVQKALGDRFGAMTNAYRNAPIQGGVADVVLDAYGRLWDEIAGRDVAPVQTVHDSIVLECAASDAETVAKILKQAMEDAMTALCPDVPARADADIRTSLDDADVIQEL